MLISHRGIIGLVCTVLYFLDCFVIYRLFWEFNLIEFCLTEMLNETIVNPVMVLVAAPITVPINHGEKLEKFNGTEFKRWQQKILFYLTTLNLAKFLYENAPNLKENEMDRQVVAAMEAWKHADFLCKNYILNGLDNT